MDPLIELSAVIIQFLQSLGTLVPPMDLIVNVLTYLADTLAYIAFVAIVYWCISERAGRSLVIVLLTTGYVNTFVKGFFGGLRPYEVLPDSSVSHDPIAVRHISKSSGFSMPSGHAQSSATFWTSLAVAFRSHRILFWGLLGASAIIVPFIALTRVYLAVHWPLDVVVGVLLGLLITVGYFMLEKPFLREVASWQLSQQARVIVGVSVILLLASFIVTCVTAVFRGALLGQPDLISYTGAALLEASPGQMVGALTGILLGFAVDKRFLQFRVGSGLLRKLFRLLVGLIPLLIISLLTNLLVGKLGEVISSSWDPIAGAIVGISLEFAGYFVLGFCAAFTLPWLFVRLEPILFVEIPARIREGRTSAEK